MDALARERPAIADGPPVARGRTPTTSDVPDDTALVTAVLGGDRDAFRHLVDREGATVVSACARILGSRADAEEVAQEAFVLAFRSLASWRGEGSLGAWVTRIAVRLAIRRSARQRRIAWVDPEVAETIAGVGWPPTDDAADPVVAVERAESTDRVRAALLALDEPYREVVALRFLGERSLAEIAAATGRPIGTVKTHLHRGLARLKTQLEEGRR